MWIGPTVPLPLPPDAYASLIKIQVINDSRIEDGFELTFALGKDLSADYSLLSTGVVDVFSRVAIAVILGVVPEFLIDGIITEHEIVPGDRPGESTLVLRGRDVRVMMDLEDKDATFPNMPDYVIATTVLGSYAQYGLVPSPVPTSDMPLELDRIPRQEETDLAFVKRLAQRNGYIFYVEPITLGTNLAYFGPETRIGFPQSALMIDMGHRTNLRSISFTNDSLAAVQSTGTFIEPLSMQAIDIPSMPSLNLPPLSSSPAQARRKALLRCMGNASAAGALAAVIASVSNAEDPVTCTGEIDCVRYGNVLRARKLVGIAGAGRTYDGNYYVRRVTHTLEPHNSYTQSFLATREGTGAMLPVVVP
ncbi:MAG TPA: hypothetical protein VIV40_25765 [Kofleriaceae bacterium]